MSGAGLTPTAALGQAEIAEVRRRIAGHAILGLYFETALAAAAAGQDNRSVRLSGAGGVVLGVDFDGLSVFTTHGALAEADLAALASWPRRTELHVPPDLAPAIRRLAGPRLYQERDLKIYVRDPAPPPAADPRCRRMTLDDGARVAAFLRQGYGDTVVSDWMFDLPFYGLFDGGELAAVAGAIVADAGLGAANIGNLFTAPAFRGRGLGRAVVAALVAGLWQAGYRTLSLGTTEDNVSAWRAAESLGFRLLERRLHLDLAAAAAAPGHAA